MMFDNNDSEQNLENVQRARAALNKVLYVEENFLWQKAKVKWWKESDRNFKYFHLIVTERRAKAVVHRIKNSNGEWVWNEDIVRKACNYFSSLFSQKEPIEHASLDHILNLFSVEDVSILEEFPSIEEIWNVVFSMDEDSAAA